MSRYADMTQRALEKHLQDYGKPGAMIGAEQVIVQADGGAYIKTGRDDGPFITEVEFTLDTGYRADNETSYPYAKFAAVHALPYTDVLAFVEHAEPILCGTLPLDDAYSAMQMAKWQGILGRKQVGSLIMLIEKQRLARKPVVIDTGFAQMGYPKSRSIRVVDDVQASVGYTGRVGDDGVLRDMEIKHTSVVHDDGAHPLRDASAPMGKRYQWPFKPPR